MTLLEKDPHYWIKVAMFNGLLGLIVSFLFLEPTHVHAQYQIVEIKNVQFATSLSAIVLDPTGAPVPGVSVEELSSDWHDSLRSTKTDTTGRFNFATVKGRDVYYLQLSMDGFDPLRVRVKIDSKRGKDLQLKLVVAT